MSVSSHSGALESVCEVYICLCTAGDLLSNAYHMAQCSAAEVSVLVADEVHSPYITATFLVPTNDAFAALLHSLGSTKQQLLANPSM